MKNDDLNKKSILEYINSSSQDKDFKDVEDSPLSLIIKIIFSMELEFITQAPDSAMQIKRENAKELLIKLFKNKKVNIVEENEEIIEKALNNSTYKVLDDKYIEEDELVSLFGISSIDPRAIECRDKFENNTKQYKTLIAQLVIKYKNNSDSVKFLLKHKFIDVSKPDFIYGLNYKDLTAFKENFDLITNSHDKENEVHKNFVTILNEQIVIAELYPTLEKTLLKISDKEINLFARAVCTGNEAISKLWSNLEKLKPVTPKSAEVITKINNDINSIIQKNEVETLDDSEQEELNKLGRSLDNALISYNNINMHPSWNLSIHKEKSKNYLQEILSKSPLILSGSYLKQTTNFKGEYSNINER
ncbi:MAG: hypothetical protein ACK4OM_04440 [Alphaproteobacteria bacterium]